MNQVKTYKIGICEDDKSQNEHLTQMIKKSCMFLSDRHSNFEINNNFYSYEEASKVINAGELSDIYFLDIQLSDDLKDANGIELANLIRKRQKDAQIIFVTTHDE